MLDHYQRLADQDQYLFQILELQSIYNKVTHVKTISSKQK